MKIPQDPLKNGKWGLLHYHSDSITVRFEETDEGCHSRLYSERERNNENYPIVAEGIVAYICEYRKDTQTKMLFDRYISLCRERYLSSESRKPDACRRDLDEEFIESLKSDETARINRSVKFFDYIQDNEVEEIKNYVENFRYYIGLNNTTKKISTEKTIKYTNPFIALVCRYRDIHITEENVADILFTFGKGPSNSGNLIRRYIFFRSKNSRTTCSGSDRTDKFNENRLSMVVSYLKSNNYDSVQAEEELDLFRKNMESRLK